MNWNEREPRRDTEATPKEGLSEKPNASVLPPSDGEVLSYIEGILPPLCKLAVETELPFIAHLMGMVLAETQMEKTKRDATVN